MNKEERLKRIMDILKESDVPVSGSGLAKALNVSRQVIVQDIALIRAQNSGIISTCQGYTIEKKNEFQRIFKVKHSDEQTEEELNLFVDCGGTIKDVFVYHKVYNVIRAEINIKSRLEVKEYLEKFKNGKSKSLKEVTSDYHYHTITAESEKVLDEIMTELGKRGFLAELRDYEPVNF